MSEGELQTLVQTHLVDPLNAKRCIANLPPVAIESAQSRGDSVLFGLGTDALQSEHLLYDQHKTATDPTIRALTRVGRGYALVKNRPGGLAPRGMQETMCITAYKYPQGMRSSARICGDLVLGALALGVLFMALSWAWTAAFSPMSSS